MRRILLATISILISTGIFAQDEKTENLFSAFKLGGEYRARGEYQHGYKMPVLEKEFGYKTEATMFVGQRTRLNFDFNIYEKVNFKLVLQDVRLWGSKPLGVAADGNLTTLHQAWAEVFIMPELSLKVGRMELKYNDSRILGNSNWTNQARSHDLALIKYKGLLNAHLGLAYNFDPENGNVYNVSESYKAMQYLWLNYAFEYIDVSLLGVNNGLSETKHVYSPVADEETAWSSKSVYSQTIGTYLNSKFGSFNINTFFYYQMGKNPADWLVTDSLSVIGMTLGEYNNNVDNDYKVGAGEGRKIKAYNFGLNLKYKIMDEFSIGAGYEMLSGDNFTEINLDDNDINNSFTPLYGSRHGKNGWMDYFYAGGNHTYSKSYYTLGLNDINLSLLYKTKKYFFKLQPHYFLTAGKGFYTGEDGTQKEIKGLGLEIDFRCGYHFIPNVAYIELGYSHMFPTEGFMAMKQLSVTEDPGTNNWIWLMLTIKPKFLNISK
ncbi:MAG: alginate export family protein [bacterium]|nr:alginate export family protein [bacterium]